MLITNMGCELFFDFGFLLIARNPHNGLAAFEQNQGWDAHNAQLTDDVLVGIGIEFADNHFARIFARQFIDDGGNHLTRSAPFCPKIDQNGLGGIDDSIIKVGFGHFYREFSHVFLLTPLYHWL